MTRPRARLLGLVIALAVGLVVFGVTDLVDAEALRDRITSLGPLAPLVYVPLSAALGAALLPGPILAATSGLLFGAWLGTVVTVAGSVLSAVLALHLGRGLGRAGARELAGARAEHVEQAVRRFGLAGVVGQRLIPGVPDAPVSYLAGALGLRSWQIALGTAIGSLPRAFAYTAVGASLDDPASPLALAGVVVWVITALVGVEVARRGLGALRVGPGGWRAPRRGPAPPARHDAAGEPWSRAGEAE